MRPPKAQNLVSNTTEIYRIIKNYGHAPFNLRWASVHGSDDPDSLRDDTFKRENHYERDFIASVIYAKKRKLYYRIYQLIQDCMDQFQSDMEDMKRLHGFKPNIEYQIIPRTQERLAFKACRYIHPIAIEFTNPRHLDWIPTRELAISQIPNPITIDNTMFIEPPGYEQLSDFHDIDQNEDNRFEIRIQKFYECFMDIFPEKYRHFEEIIQSKQSWTL